MTKEELREIIHEAQKAAQGCGCCENEDIRFEELQEAVTKIWAEFLLLHKVIERGKF